MTNCTVPADDQARLNVRLKTAEGWLRVLAVAWPVGLRALSGLDEHAGPTEKAALRLPSKPLRDPHRAPLKRISAGAVTGSVNRKYRRVEPLRSLAPVGIVSAAQ